MHTVLSDAQVGSGNRPWVAFRTDLLQCCCMYLHVLKDIALSLLRECFCVSSET